MHIYHVILQQKKSSTNSGHPCLLYRVSQNFCPLLVNFKIQGIQNKLKEGKMIIYKRLSWYFLIVRMISVSLSIYFLDILHCVKVWKDTYFACHILSSFGPRGSLIDHVIYKVYSTISISIFFISQLVSAQFPILYEGPKVL